MMDRVSSRPALRVILRVAGLDSPPLTAATARPPIGTLRMPAPPPHHLHVIRDYRDLRVWIAAMDRAQAVYLTTAAFPSP
jgi:hypothetical protein